MTIRRFVGVTVAALLGSLTLQMQAAQAQVPYPKSGQSYKVRMARAMDQCVSGITVVNPGGVQACAQANSATDSSITSPIKAVLNISSGSQVRISVGGSGFTPPASRVGVQITLRTTNTLGSPAGSKTYQDETLICGSVDAGMCGHYFPSDPFGRIVGRMTLKDCLTANGFTTDLAAGNIEILDTALINCDTGKVIAVPGILKK